MKRYLIVSGDDYPFYVSGPYDSEEERKAAARGEWENDPEQDYLRLAALDIDDSGKPEVVHTYFFDDEADDEDTEAGEAAAGESNAAPAGRESFWLIYRFGGVGGEKIGPFATPKERDAEARRYFGEVMSEEDDLEALDVDADGTPHVWGYPGAFADEALRADQPELFEDTEEAAA